MHITAVYEPWFFDDGNYPLLRRGQRVNLSFEMQIRSLLPAGPGLGERLVHLGGGFYDLCGTVLRAYQRPAESLVVLEANQFRFYVHHWEGVPEVGDRVSAEGMLSLDHYIWVENLDRYEDAPDLFYQLSVERITRVTIPERFISRYLRGKSLPASLGPSEYAPEDTQEIETMEGQRLDEEFYFVDFAPPVDGEAVPRTFHS